jgi:hypothetical protein
MERRPQGGVEGHGGRWLKDAQCQMMGMSSTEWSSYMHDTLGVKLSPEEISATVVARLEELYGSSCHCSRGHGRL